MSILEVTSRNQFWQLPHSARSTERGKPFTNGSSGAKVDLGIHPDSRARTIVKTNTADPRRIHREIEGTRTLLGHAAYARWILTPLHIDEESPRIVYPYVEGIDLRTALLTGRLQDADVMRVAQLLKRVEEDRAHELTTRTSDGVHYVSMQRGEWGDTLARIAKLHEDGILREVNPEAPIIVGDRTFPSTNDVIRRVNGLMSTPPPYVDLGHNDLTQSNVLLTGDPNNPFVLIDHEWAGFADPAESFVRTAKAKKTYDLPRGALNGLHIDGGVITIPEPAQHAHQPTLFEGAVYDATRSMAHRYNDGQFVDRVALYRAGSYLRECAMSDTRSTPQHGLYAIVEASMVIDETL